MLPRNKSLEKNDYNAQLDAILSTPLTPANIDHYAESALNEVANLVDTYTHDYRHQPTVLGETAVDNEARASRYHGLSNVNDILDHLQVKQEEIDGISQVISTAVRLESVILAPDSPKREVVTGNGTFEQPSTIKRLKTTLFILKNEFNVDIHSPQELKISTGQTTDRMMRRQSYFSLESPKLNRLILVCDEEGSASFVFDTKKMSQQNIPSETILSSSKNELKRLTIKYPSMGVWIRYNEKKFAGYIERAIKLPVTELCSKRGQSRKGRETSYLYPVAPEGVLSVSGMVSDFKVSQSSIAKVIKEANINPSGKYRFGMKPTYGYDQQLQDQIKAELSQRGLLAEPPEGTLSVAGIAKLFNVNYRSISRALSESEIQPSGIYKLGSKLTNGYDPHAQNEVFDILKEKGLFAEEAPEGMLSASGLSKLFGVADSSITKTITELEMESRGKYKFGASLADGYNAHDQELVKVELEKRGLFSEEAPEGILTVVGMASQLNASRGAVHQILKELGIDSVGKFRFGKDVAEGYDSQIQEQVKVELEKRGLFSEEAPEDVLSLHGVASAFGVTPPSVSKVLAALKIKPSGKYRFGHKLAEGYDAITQNQIFDGLGEKVIRKEPPEGELSIAGMSQLFGVGGSAIGKVISDLKVDSSGMYRFGSKPAKGYGKHSQELVKVELEKRGLLSEEAPEDVLSLLGVSILFGVADSSVRKAIAEAGIKPSGKYKFGAKPAYGYNPEAQNEIFDILKEKGLFAEQSENVLSASGIAKRFNVDRKHINRALSEAEIPPTGRYRFGKSKITDGYDEEAQSKILAELKRKGVI